MFYQGKDGKIEREYLGDTGEYYRASIKSRPIQNPEWLYRWAARATGGNCSAETAISIILIARIILMLKQSMGLPTQRCAARRCDSSIIGM
jgi:hypothetical protein